MKTSRQQADFEAVTKHLEKHPGTTKKDAIKAVAKVSGKSEYTVLSNYYRIAKRAGVTAAPPKKPTTTKKTTNKPKGLDLNIIRASLQSAMNTIDLLEQQNKKNEEIINGLRKALI